MFEGDPVASGPARGTGSIRVVEPRLSRPNAAPTRPDSDATLAVVEAERRVPPRLDLPVLPVRLELEPGLLHVLTVRRLHAASRCCTASAERSGQRLRLLGRPPRSGAQLDGQTTRPRVSPARPEQLPSRVIAYLPYASVPSDLPIESTGAPRPANHGQDRQRRDNPAHGTRERDVASRRRGTGRGGALSDRPDGTRRQVRRPTRRPVRQLCGARADPGMGCARCAARWTRTRRSCTWTTPTTATAMPASVMPAPIAGRVGARPPPALGTVARRPSRRFTGVAYHAGRWTSSEQARARAGASWRPGPPASPGQFSMTGGGWWGESR